MNKENIGSQIVMSSIKSQGQRMVDGMSNNQQSNVNDPNYYNFPPLLRIIHFKLSEIQDTQKKSVVLKIYISFILTIVVQILNVINAIIQTSYGLKGIIIFYAFLNLFILIPANFYVFHKGQEGVLYTSSYLFRYKIMQFILMLLWIVFSIWPLGSFNGWVKVHQLFHRKPPLHSLPFPAVVGIFESLIYTANYIICGWLLFQLHKQKESLSNKI